MLSGTLGRLFACLRPKAHQAVADRASCEQQRQASTQAEVAAALQDAGKPQPQDQASATDVVAAAATPGAVAAPAAAAAATDVQAAARAATQPVARESASADVSTELPATVLQPQQQQSQQRQSQETQLQPQQQPLQPQPLLPQRPSPHEQQQRQRLSLDQLDKHQKAHLQQATNDTDPLWHAWMQAAQSAAQEEAEHGPYPEPSGTARAPGLPHNAFHSGAPRPACEEERTAHVVNVTRVLDKMPKKGLQSIMQMVCNIFKVKTTFISVLEGSRIFIIDKAGDVGVLEGVFAWRWSFCAWSLASQRSQVMMINDTLQDARFCDNHYVKTAGVRCYAGCPLVSSGGHRLGTLCFADAVPRMFDSSSLQILMNLSELVTRELEHFAALQPPLEPAQQPQLQHQPQQLVPVLPQQLPQQLTSSASGSLQSVGSGEAPVLLQHPQQSRQQLPMQPYQLLLRSIECIESAVLMVDTSAQQWPVLHASSGWQKLAQQLQAPAALSGRTPAQGSSSRSGTTRNQQQHQQQHDCKQQQQQQQHSQQRQQLHVQPGSAAVAGGLHGSASSSSSSSGSLCGIGVSFWSLLDVDSLRWKGASNNSSAKDQMLQQAANSQSLTVAGAKLAAGLGGGAVQLVFRCAGFSTVQGAVSVCLPPATPDRSEVAAAAAALSNSCPTGHRVLPTLTPSHCLYFVTVRPLPKQLPEGGSRSSGYFVNSCSSPGRYLPWMPSDAAAAAQLTSGEPAAAAGCVSGGALGPSSSSTVWQAAAGLDGGAAAAPVVDVCSNPQCSAAHDTCSSLTDAGWMTEKDVSLADLLANDAAPGDASDSSPATAVAAENGSGGAAGIQVAAHSAAAAGRMAPAYESGIVYSTAQLGPAAPNASAVATAATATPAAAPTSSGSTAAGSSGGMHSTSSTSGDGSRQSAVTVTPHSALATGYGGFDTGGAHTSGSISSGGSSARSSTSSARNSNSGHQMSMLAGLVCEHIEGLALGGQVASGSYGRVFRGTYFGSKVAVKVLDGSDVLKRDAATGCSLEALLSSELRHPSIISTHTWAVVSGKGEVPARVQVWGKTLEGKPNTIKGRAAATAAAAAAAAGAATPKAGAARVPPFGTGAVQPAALGAHRSATASVAADAGDAAWTQDKHPAASSAAAASGGSPDAAAAAAAGATSAAGAAGGGVAATAAGPVSVPDAGANSGGSGSSGSGRANWGSDGANSFYDGGDSDGRSAVLKGQTWLILEYADKGCLQDAVDQGWLRQRRSFVEGGLNLSAVLATAAEIASGMAYLHKMGVVHGDLSPYNVLLSSADPAASLGDRGFVVKVADFGLARVLHQGGSKVFTKTYGTITHMAPEVLEHGLVSKAADVYSFGVLLWQMVCGSRAWAGMCHAAIVQTLCIKKQGLKFPADAPDALVALGSACLDFDPAARPTFSDILEVLEPCQALLAQGCA